MYGYKWVEGFFLKILNDNKTHKNNFLNTGLLLHIQHETVLIHEVIKCNNKSMIYITFMF